MRAMMGALLSRARADARPRRHRPLRAAALLVPLEAENSQNFAARASRIVDDPRAQLYLDTSFLMWMIRVGGPARAELITWLNSLGKDRVHVPSWSAHELYKHHVDRTIPKELIDTLDTFESSARKSFNLIWPLLGEPLAGAVSAQAQRNDAREAFRAVRGLIANVRTWAPGYNQHAAEVVGFANHHALRGSAVFDHLGSIEALAKARFTGRVPPGFQDRNKTEIIEKCDMDGADGSSIVGSNRWGDLIFWNEILDDARARRATGIVILTKDIKNDWRMGGTLPVAGEAGDTGEAPAHPTLVFEAAQRAGVRELLLLDHRRLATMFDVADIAGEAFIAACKAPPATVPKTEAEKRAEDTQRALAERSAQRAAEAQRVGMLFPDPAGLAVSEAKLFRALVQTEGVKRDALTAAVALAHRIEQAANEDEPLLNVLTGEALGALDHVALVALTRQLGLASLERPLLETSLSDCVALLAQMPPATAGYLYMGFLAAMYLEPDSNAFRPCARSPAAQQLFAYQGDGFAALPIALLRARSARADRFPIYLPDPATPTLAVEMEVDGDLAEPLALRALFVNEHQLLTPAQGEVALQLRARFADVPATPVRLLDHIADLYALPRAQLDAVTGVTTQFSLQEYWGFKSPMHVFDVPPEGKVS